MREPGAIGHAAIGAAASRPVDGCGCVRAWIGLGGNRMDSGDLLDQALEFLAAVPDVHVLRRSRTYRAAPWGGLDQPDFVNAVAELETGLQPQSLLRLMLSIEERLGRKRAGPRWGPRCIDLDLLTYEQLRLRLDDLELPHPQMHRRAFVLLPLVELEPAFVIPGVGPAVDCLQNIDPGETAAVVPHLPGPEEQGT
jgi:2-amino-4-hydroxy-6-hydroxymethyldihydropteridine diphosphokinase